MANDPRSSRERAAIFPTTEASWGPLSGPTIPPAPITGTKAKRAKSCANPSSSSTNRTVTATEAWSDAGGNRQYVRGCARTDAVRAIWGSNCSRSSRPRVVLSLDMGVAKQGACWRPARARGRSYWSALPARLPVTRGRPRRLGVAMRQRGIRPKRLPRCLRRPSSSIRLCICLRRFWSGAVASS